MSAVRCPGCYLPMEHDWLRELHRCSLCACSIFDEELYYRGRWRRWWDRLTGMVA